MAPHDPFLILFVCTGNICRTPMAVGLFNDLARRDGLGFEAESVGLLRSGQEASAHGVTVMGDRGIDITAHRSRRMTAEHLADADLVVGLAREHVREAVVLDQTAFDRAFTLKELVRRAEAAPPRGRDESLIGWCRRIAAGRQLRDLLGDDPADDVADPVGQPLAAYEQTAAELDDLIRRMLRQLRPAGATAVPEDDDDQGAVSA